jgi:hypothetical protein
MNPNNDQNKPLTAADLYAPSTDTDIPPVPNNPELVYEETPIIEPIVDEPQSQPVSSAPDVSYTPPQNGNPNNPKKSKFMINLIIIIVLLAAGVGASVFIRNMQPDYQLENKTSVVVAPTPTVADIAKENTNLTDTPVSTTKGGVIVNPTAVPSNPKSVKPITDSSWKNHTFQSKSGITVSYQMPNSVLDLVCDGGSCPSQGAYLPGKTRLTLDTKSYAFNADDFSKTIITDAGGKKFTTTATTVLGKPSLEFTGTFNGITTGGYAFTQMHGFMILISTTETLEINHFAPAGIQADFAGDDQIFNTVVKSLTISK